MENKQDYILLVKLISSRNYKLIAKYILGGAVVGVCAAISLILFLNMLVAFDWLSDEIIRFFSGA
jgi:hypothetical protein